MLEESAEAFLIDQLRSGDERATEIFTLQYGPRLARFAVLRGFAQADAEEIVQDTLLAVISQLRSGRFRNESNFGTWVVSILRNKIADRYRKNIRDDSTTQALRDAHGVVPSVANSQGQLEIVVAIRNALTKLHDEDRAILLLYETERYNIREIAAFMQTSESRVYRKLTDARAKMRTLLGDFECGSESRLVAPTKREPPED